MPKFFRDIASGKNTSFEEGQVPNNTNLVEISQAQFQKEQTPQTLTPQGGVSGGVADQSVLPDAQQFNPEAFSDNDIVGSSDEITQSVEGLGAAADDLSSMISDDSLLDSVLKQETFSETKEGQNQLASIRGLSEALGSLTPQELQSVEAAGVEAGAAFDPLIGEATEAKRVGLPKATVAAGERGGFLSTQFSGAAALAAIEDESFVGAGGQLENIKSVFDSNISSLKARKQQAILAAKSAARQAQLTRKKSDIDQAVKLFELAKTANDDANNLAREKIEIITNLEQVALDRAEVKREAKAKEAETTEQIRQFEATFGLQKDQITKAENTFQRGLIEEGFRRITSPDELAEISKIKGINSENEDQFIARIPNPDGTEDIFLRPTELQEIETQFIKNAAGSDILINKETGETIRDFGKSKSLAKGAAGIKSLAETFKFSADRRTDLVNAGVPITGIENIEQSIRNGNSIDDIIKSNPGISDKQEKILRGIADEELSEIEQFTPEEFQIFLQQGINDEGEFELGKFPASQRGEVAVRAAKEKLLEDNEETKSILTRFVEPDSIAGKKLKEFFPNIFKK